jgi:hypothetical protein
LQNTLYACMLGAFGKILELMCRNNDKW